MIRYSIEKRTEQYSKELERIAQKRYRTSYRSLCFAKKRTVQIMFQAGGY